LYGPAQPGTGPRHLSAGFFDRFLRLPELRFEGLEFQHEPGEVVLVAELAAVLAVPFHPAHEAGFLQLGDDCLYAPRLDVHPLGKGLF